MLGRARCFPVEYSFLTAALEPIALVIAARKGSGSAAEALRWPDLSQAETEGTSARAQGWPAADRTAVDDGPWPGLRWGLGLGQRCTGGRTEPLTGELGVTAQGSLSWPSPTTLVEVSAPGPPSLEALVEPMRASAPWGGIRLAAQWLRRLGGGRRPEWERER